MNKKILSLPFCDFEFYNNYVIGIIKDGTIVSENEAAIFTGATELFLGDKPFVYISNRIHNYAVDPSIYKNLSLNNNMVGFAVVSNNLSALTSAEVEKLFYDRPFEIFNGIEEAKYWADGLLTSHKKAI